MGEGSHRGGWKHGKGGERARRFNVHEVPLGEEKQLEHMRGSQKDGHHQHVGKPGTLVCLPWNVNWLTATVKKEQRGLRNLKTPRA